MPLVHDPGRNSGSIEELPKLTEAQQSAVQAIYESFERGGRRRDQNAGADDQPRRQGRGVFCQREDRRHRRAGERQIEFVHFACTSEDINNLSHALMLIRARERAGTGHGPAHRRDRQPRGSPRRPAHALPHPRPACLTHHARQGDGQRPRAPADGRQTPFRSSRRSAR